MKIVIDIPDEVYNDIKSNEEIITYVARNGGGSSGLKGSLAILNGTILPKGHGRLIDTEVWKIKNHTVEYYDDEHLYLVDGEILPSITTLLKKKFGKKYD